MTLERIPPVLNSPDKIQLNRLSHVYLAHPDLDEFHQFALDFGFQEAGRDGDKAIYYCGYGKDPCAYVSLKAADGQRRFDGAAYVAQTEADFVKATNLPGASQVTDSKAPGGGRIVTIQSPSGSKIHVVWGVQERPVPAKAETSTEIHKGGFNTALEKSRKGSFQRFKVGPAMVHKLGHYGFSTNLFLEDVAFYTTTFNFVPSDILYEVLPDGSELDALTFMHLDHGANYVDHHTLFLFRAPKDIPEKHSLHHCSFEVEDFDTQFLGHELLLQKGYTPVWGVGRHILGSQIFDYWKDPSGFTIEHYTDGDLVNVDNGTGREKSEGAASMYIWGPVRPEGGVAE